MMRPAWICIVLLTLFMAACGGGGNGSAAPLPTQTAVPAVTGLTESAAINAISQAGFNTTATGQTSATVPAGDVISQSPAAGALAFRGTTVNLVISGTAQGIVPNVVGDTQAAAAAAIVAAGLQFGDVEQETSATVPVRIVIAQRPAAGTALSSGALVFVTVSIGPPQAMPNVVGDTLAVATTAITSLNLTVDIVTQGFSATVPLGSVISESPPAGTPNAAAYDITLVVSSIKSVTVPNVVGDTQSAALTAITTAGLVVGGVAPVESTTVALGSVLAQTPAAGSTVASGSAINFSVSSGVQPVEKVLHSFTGCPGGSTCGSVPPPDGSSPAAGLIRGSDGNFYGTTSTGGSFNQGTVFKITPTGVETILHTFSGFGGVSGSADGAEPGAPLILASDGNFYGTTTYGGGYSVGGTVFSLSPGGAEAVLYSFSGCDDPEPCGIQGSADGANPDGLVQGSDGNFYGTTSAGGTNKYGTVFSLSPAGAEAVLHSFFTGSPGDRDALTPNGLIQVSGGNFYGTAQNSTVFRITPAGDESVLYTFPGSGADGGVPKGNLILASDGNFYGTTSQGGASNGGTVFSLTAAGVQTMLYSFVNVSGSLDGNSPSGALMQGSDGNFYGTTTLGGLYNQGTVFMVTPGGAETVLYSFSGCYLLQNEGSICGINGSTDGAGPVGGLIEDSAGNLYGATMNGGTESAGTIFKLTGVIIVP